MRGDFSGSARKRERCLMASLRRKSGAKPPPPPLRRPQLALRGDDLRNATRHESLKRHRDCLSRSQARQARPETLLKRNSTLTKTSGIIELQLTTMRPHLATAAQFCKALEHAIGELNAPHFNCLISIASGRACSIVCLFVFVLFGSLCSLCVKLRNCANCGNMQTSLRARLHVALASGAPLRAAPSSTCLGKIRKVRSQFSAIRASSSSSKNNSRPVQFELHFRRS